MANDLSDVLERSSDCVVQTDVHGFLTYLNPSAQATLGLGPMDPLRH